jgi:hypothetical protein
MQNLTKPTQQQATFKVVPQLLLTIQHLNSTNNALNMFDIEPQVVDDYC